MKRVASKPRRGWQKTVESQGLLYHTQENGHLYWNEGAYYEFTAFEIDEVEKATNALQAMCLEAGQHVIEQNLFANMGIGVEAEKLIRKTWQEEPPAIYGRFDLAYNGRQIRMLEYNADTPTSLLEAAVIQWYWLRDLYPKADQFNSIHERLLAKWKELVPYVGPVVHFSSLENYEDIMTNTYMMETARQAGISVIDLAVREIGWNSSTNEFVDLNNRNIHTLFKLYPWENLLLDEFGKHIAGARSQFMEPAWKMLWSNKAILAVLWELFPSSEYLLPAYFDPDPFRRSGREYVSKPFISREGANVTVVRRNGETRTEGRYDGPRVYQQYADLQAFDGFYPVLGSWVIDGVSAGMGIREDSSVITGVENRFVPHLFT